jgi:peroxiredoxin (alkyl hydroperoxide reductase subunit C)
MIGDKAPAFKAETTMGELNFPEDYYMKWKILFSHPADFTPVCTSELLELAYLQNDFESMNTKLVVLSTDGINSHIEWVKSIESINYKDRGKVKVKFPLISDIGLKVSKKYGMIHRNATETHTIRGVYIIDPENVIRAIFFYPLDIGRNIDEIKRSLSALQEIDGEDYLTPANWNVGDDLLLPAPKTIKESEQLKNKKSSDLYSLDWYMWFLRKK